jgi:hypothetical protein
MMPTTRLIEVKTYLDPDVFEWMEQDRSQMRRTSKSRYIQECILEHKERARPSMPPRPTHDNTSRRR